MYRLGIDVYQVFGLWVHSREVSTVTDLRATSLLKVVVARYSSYMDDILSCIDRWLVCTEVFGVVLERFDDWWGVCPSYQVSVYVSLDKWIGIGVERRRGISAATANRAAKDIEKGFKGTLLFTSIQRHMPVRCQKRRHVPNFVSAWAKGYACLKVNMY